MLVFRNERRRGHAGDLVLPLRLALKDRSSEGRLRALILAGMSFFLFAVSIRRFKTRLQ